MNSEVANIDVNKIPETYYTNRGKYKKTIKTDDQIKNSKTVLEVKESTDIKQLTAFVIDLMYNKQFPHVKLKGISKNMSKCVLVAEQIKRKIRNLHQINQIQTLETKESFIPDEESEDYYPFQQVKNQTLLLITLSKQTPLNIKQPGYQKPIEIKFVSTRDPREYIRYVLEEKKVPKKKKVMAEQREEDEKQGNRKQFDFDDECEIEGDFEKNKNFKDRQSRNYYRGANDDSEGKFGASNKDWKKEQHYKEENEYKKNNNDFEAKRNEGRYEKRNQQDSKKNNDSYYKTDRRTNQYYDYETNNKTRKDYVNKSNSFYKTKEDHYQNQVKTKLPNEKEVVYEEKITLKKWEVKNHENKDDKKPNQQENNDKKTKKNRRKNDNYRDRPEIVYVKKEEQD